MNWVAELSIVQKLKDCLKIFTQAILANFQSKFLLFQYKPVSSSFLGNGGKELVAILRFNNLSDSGSLLLEQVFKK